MSSVLETNHADATDQRLLELYRRKRSHQAFEELVTRYGPMVMGVAQRMLGCAHSAEDVVQATFLVLARDARKIRKSEALASWLYGVAFRISARHIQRRARQNVSALHEDVMISDDPLEKLSEQFEQQTAFEELHRLPKKLRAAMVLRYLQGKSNAEVAKSLALSESAVEGRLKRGRNQLRLRLARQGVTFAAAVAALEAIKEYAEATEATDLVAKTVEVCFPSGAATAPGSQITQLANEEMLRMTTTTVLRNAMAAALTVGVLAAGLSIAGNVDLNAQDNAAEVVLKDQSPGETSPDASSNIKSGNAQYFYYSTSKNKQPETAAANSRYSYENYGAAETRIMRAMQQPTEVFYAEVPLGDVIADLAERHQIQIMLDPSGLAGEGVTEDVTINVDLSNIRLKSALALILDQHNLTTIIKDEVLLVTSQARASQTMAPRVYRQAPEWDLSTDDLIQVITSSCSPAEWDDVGGPGSIVAIKGGLVISTSVKVHDQINDLLGQIDRFHATGEQ